MSRKKKKEPYSAFRNTWTRTPWTQVKENDKAYNRKKEKQKLHQTFKERDGGVFLPYFA